MESKLRRYKRERVDTLADLYAIIKTTERLERAFIRDVIGSADYESECYKLISQFKSLASAMGDAVPSVEEFARNYRMDCPAALYRLIVAGIPATKEHRASPASIGNSCAASVAECVQHFITAMDSVKLNMVAVDQVYPVLSDLSSALAKIDVNIIPDDFEGRHKVREWLARLSKMSAADELTEEEASQLHVELDSSYEAFKNALPKGDAASA